MLADVQNGHHKNGSVAFAEEAVTVNVGEVKLNGDHKKEPALYKQGHGKVSRQATSAGTAPFCLKYTSIIQSACSSFTCLRVSRDAAPRPSPWATCSRRS